MSPLPHPLPRSLRALVLSMLLPLFLLGGCATTNPRDPLEPMNRAIYSFNDTVDNAVFRPVAEGYRRVLPAFLRTGVSNVFANINDVLIALNNLLQGKIVSALSDLGRVIVNSTVGIAGFFDVATNLGLEKHNEDFGQTLGSWGIGDGPYLVLPILGPSNLRDAVSRVVDFKTDPLTYVRSMSLRMTLWGTRALSLRADLLDTSKILDTAALDPYEFLRDAYLQRRRNLVYDGAPPREKDDDFDIKTKPRTGNPFLRFVEGSAGTPDTRVAISRPDDWTPARTEAQDAMRPDDWTPARAEAQEAERVALAADATTPAAPVQLQQTTPAETPAATAQTAPSTAAQPDIAAPSAETTAAQEPTVEPQAVSPVLRQPPQVTATPEPPVLPETRNASELPGEIVLPVEPTAAGEPAVVEPQPAAQRVVRVWVTAVAH